MNSDQMKGKWKQMKGSVKERWGKLTDDDLDVIDGESDQLIGKIQERYGLARQEAQKQVDEWNANLTRGSEVERERNDERLKAS
ncbi:MAG TPA: CsbD family protein [Terriglobales bacterium]|nr:CsbD family protein [Terriglobales bacterium]